jgi:hypothetical protein
MRGWGAVPATRGEFDVCAGAWNREKHPVIAVVVNEPADLRKPNPVSVELDHLV